MQGAKILNKSPVRIFKQLQSNGASPFFSFLIWTLIFMVQLVALYFICEYLVDGEAGKTLHSTLAISKVKVMLILTRF